MPFSQHRREDDASPSQAEGDRTCVWTLTLDGLVEHTTARGVFGAPMGRTGAAPLPWREFWPAEGRASVDRAVAMASAGQVSRFRLLASAGSSERTYWETAVAPVRTRSGAVVSLLATSRDVTVEVEQDSLLNTVVQLLPSPVVVKDVESGRYILWNRAAELAFNVGADAIVGAGSLDILGADLADAFAEAELEAVQSGERRVRSVASLRQADGRTFDLHTLATFDDFGARHLISLCNDVSERHAAAVTLRAAVGAAEQASEAKSRFLANMSHELRTPMNGIMAGADMLAAQTLPTRAKELVGLIQASSSSLERLLSGILDLAAIEAGGITFKAAPFHLGDLVRQVTGLARLAADEKGVALGVLLDPSADGVVDGDAVRIGQVLTNLLANAAKFTERGEIHLEASRQADLVRFSVSDTGIGFDAEAKDRIFEPFQQGDSSITRRFGGSGLGLAITNDLVTLMGGRLECDSRPGAGSRFWFDLPLPQVAGAESVEPTGQELITPANLRVLAADDHPTNRRVVELLLAEVAEVVCVADGREAVEAYQAAAFDLVLMDMQMPIMDGLEAVREIRAIELAADRSRTPILMLSANVGPEHISASREAGADLHIGKPITAERLFAAIGEILE